MTRILLTTSVSLAALLAATGASAQTTPTNTGPASTGQAQTDTPVPVTDPTAEQADQGNDVVVTGYRASLRASVDAKRNSSVIADVLSAEDIGKFPDKNVAEALQRVPGIVINREFGEGERVSLRGTAPNLTKALIDGHAVATADWFILEQLTATRSFNYLTLPSEIVGQLDVYKSPRADVEEGGVGGTINVHTRRPLDQQRFLLSASVQGVYSEKRERVTPLLSGIFSWKNDAETFGVLVGGVYERRDIRRDGLEVLGYEPYSTPATIANPNTAPGQPATIANPVYRPALAGVQVPSLIGSALFLQERKRYGGNIDVQFRPSPNLEVNLSGLYSRFQADNFNQNFLAAPRYAAQGSATIANPTVRDGYLVGATVNAPNFAAFFDAIDRKAHATTAYGDLDVEWSPSDTATLHLKGGYTEAHGNTDSQPFYEGDNPGSYSFDISGRVPKVSFLSGIDPRDPSTLKFDFGSNHQVLNTDTEYYGYADFTKKVDWGAISALKVGAKYTNHLRSTYNDYTTYGGFFLPVSATGCGGPCTTANFVSGKLTPGNYLDGIGGGAGVLDSYFQIDRRKLESIYYGVPANRVYYPFDSFRVRERVYGGYALVEAGGDDWGANFGLRVVHTEQISSGNQNGTAGPGTITGNPYGDYTPVTVSRGYTDFLPSANIRLNVAPTVTLRFAAGRTVARADYTDIVPRVSLNPGTLTGAGGSPFIDPFRANQADVSLEWYPDRDTIVAAAFYYKDVQSYITSSIVTEAYPVQSPANDPRYTTVCAPTGTVITPAQGATPAVVLFSCPFRIDRRGNGPGGTNKGFELQVQRTLYAGFGVNLNYTYSDASISGGLPVQGNSKHALNATAFFENDLVSARLSYNYRSKFFITYDRASPLNQKAIGSLDASASINVTDNVALTANAVNLTNEKIEQYSGDTNVFRAIYDNGRQYYLGARFRF